jgi:hypothetical protein
VHDVVDIDFQAIAFYLALIAQMREQGAVTAT